jgi:electron-transferring-flavoprotein dehydrogenase
MTSKPSDYPPPFHASEFITGPTDPLEARIEVGVLVVGAGPAGLACAIRFGQLLNADPETAELLGEVPLAIIDKGKQPGSHLLSGAVINPRSLKSLFGDSFRIEDIPNYGQVNRESVYVLTRTKSIPIPPPPPMRNHGNVIVSLSELGRWLAARAEEAGAMVLPETPGRSLLLDDGRVVGVRTADKGRSADGGELRNFEPGADVVAQITVLAEGTQGHLTGVALDHFGLRPKAPQVYELAVKEVWRVDSPLDRVITTMGWPLRTAAKYREFGGSFIYPIGKDRLTIGMVVGLDYRDAEISVHDLLQEVKTHPKIRPLLEGGERLEWGAKTIPSGGFHALPTSLHAPGLLLCGDGAGMVNISALKGVHYAVESGRLAAETAFETIKRTAKGDLAESSGLASYDNAVRSSFIWSDLHKARDVRQAFGRGFFLGGALASAMIVSKGRVHIGRMSSERDDDQELIVTNRAAQYPTPDGKLVFDKLSSVFASGNETRDDQPDHLRLQHRVPGDVARMWSHMCPARVYEVDEADGADGLASVRVTPSNCVQCGAISAKGGRLTPAEGGSGPEYSVS